MKEWWVTRRIPGMKGSVSTRVVAEDNQSAIEKARQRISDETGLQVFGQVEWIAEETKPYES